MDDLIERLFAILRASAERKERARSNGRRGDARRADREVTSDDGPPRGSAERNGRRDLAGAC